MSKTLTKPAGRPCLLTDELQAKICAYIAAGNYLATACAAVGISDETFRKWLEKGKTELDAGETSGRFSAFIGAVKRAEADREAIIVGRLVDAAMPGVKKRVTKPLIHNGLPVFDKAGNIIETTETTETGGEWLAAATFLERRHPDRWARPAPINQQGSGTTYNINIEKAIIDAAGKFDTLMARLATRTAAPLAMPATTDDPSQSTADPSQAPGPSMADDAL